MINGFFVIDKPAGITSHDVVSRVRRILGTRKVGHTGTLDPFATGVLPIAVNDGTKVIPFLDEGVKQYEAVMRLGVTTDTLDTTGTVLAEVDPGQVSREHLVNVLMHFTGSVSQTPPMFSAIKQNGQPLYKLARQGVEVERKARQIEITSLELTLFDQPYAAFDVKCSRGTYVRSLADDIGSSLGCGAALQELRRTASGPFTIEAAVTLEQLENAVGDDSLEKLCLSPHAALGHLADVVLTASECDKIRHGRSPTWPDLQAAGTSAVSIGSLVRLSRNGELIAVANCELSSEGTVHLILKRVFN